MDSLLTSILIFTVASPFVTVGRSLGSRDDMQCYFASSDVIFVVDESESVGQADFTVGLNAVALLTESLVIGTGATDSSVGFVLFDMDGHLVFGLNQYTNNADVANAIRNVSYDGGDTNIAGGMDTALDEFKVHYNGKVNSLMIIITDGHDDSDVSTSYRSALFVGVDVWALAVGNKTNIDELIKATGDPSHVISVDDYAHLFPGLKQICYDIGTTVYVEPTTPVSTSPKTQLPCGCDDLDDDRILDAWLDIIVVIDSSQAVSDVNFNDMKVFLEEMAMAYQIGQSADPAVPGKFSRVALITNADGAEIVANLTTFKSSDDMVKAAQKLQRINGNFHPYDGVVLVSQIVNEKINSQDRLNAQTVVMVFSTSVIKCGSLSENSRRKSSYRKSRKQNLEDEAMCEMVAQMTSDGVVFITVGIASTDMPAPYIDIAKPCNRINNTADMNGLIAVALCRANCYCPTPTVQYALDNSCKPYAECLYLTELAQPYSYAEAVCVSENGHLPDVFTGEKQAFLNQLHIDAKRVPYWLGGKVKNDAIIWETGRYNTSVSGNNGDYIRWDPTWTPTAAKPCLMASAGFTLLWKTDKDGQVTPTHYFSCQTEACSVRHYCD